MDEHTDLYDLNLSPTCIVRCELDHVQHSLTLRLYQSPILDKKTQKLGPLEIVREQSFHSRRSKRLARLLSELTVIEEKIQ